MLLCKKIIWIIRFAFSQFTECICIVTSLATMSLWWEEYEHYQEVEQGCLFKLVWFNLIVTICADYYQYIVTIKSGIFWDTMSRLVEDGSNLSIFLNTVNPLLSYYIRIYLWILICKKTDWIIRLDSNLLWLYTFNVSLQ